MPELPTIVLWTVVLVALVGAGLLLRNLTSREARERRRRQRSHGRVVSRAARPMVSLAVEVDAAKPEDKR